LKKNESVEEFVSRLVILLDSELEGIDEDSNIERIDVIHEAFNLLVLAFSCIGNCTGSSISLSCSTQNVPHITYEEAICSFRHLFISVTTRLIQKSVHPNLDDLSELAQYLRSVVIGDREYQDDGDVDMLSQTM